YDTAIAIWETLPQPSPEDQNDLAAAYMNRGNVKQHAPGHGTLAAIADYDRAIVLQEALRTALGEEWPPPWRHNLASAYASRGNPKQYAAGHGVLVAITDYDQAIVLLDALRAVLGEGWPLPWRETLAGVYMNRGAAKQHAPGHGMLAAIADYDRAIVL